MGIDGGSSANCGTRNKRLSLRTLRTATEQRGNLSNDISLDTIIRPYRIVSKIGAGGMVRCIALQRFEQEAKATSALQSLTDELTKEYPKDTLINSLWLPTVRAAALQGDSTTARKAYQDFFALWKDADSDIPVLMEAKKEYEKLK